MMLMWRYYELISDKDLNEIRALRAQVEDGSLHPMESKKITRRRSSLRAFMVAAADGGAKLFRNEIPEES